MEQIVTATVVLFAGAYLWLKIRRRPLTLEEQWRVLGEWGKRVNREIEQENSVVVGERR